MAKRASVDFVLRPFEGLPGEPDWVAMREVVPAATGTARTTEEYGARDVVVATVLPMAYPALHRADGTLMIGLQQTGGSGDLSRDLAAYLLQAMELPAGTAVTATGLPEPGPRLQDVLDLTVPFEVTVHDGFEYWVEGTELDANGRHVLEEMNDSILPTRKVASVDAAYWVRMGGKEFVRWAQPHDEEVFLDALARLHARRESGLGDGGAIGRFIGAFRSCGVVVPVWELDRGTEVEEIEAPMRELSDRLDDALSQTEPLDATQRRARAGLVARQLTLR